MLTTLSHPAAARLSSQGKCWGWNPYLVVSHSIGSLLIWFGFTFITFAALWVYKRGGLAQIYTTYPSLWRWGMGFLFCCGMARLGEFLEIFYGGKFYYVTAGLKIVTGGFALGFACVFVRAANDLVAMAKLIGIALKADNG
jgi:hypothetical protein